MTSEPTATERDEAAAKPADRPAPRPERPAEKLPAYDGDAFGLEAGKVQQIAIEDLSLDDQTYRFRIDLRPEVLVDSIMSHGMQIPLIARPHPKKDDKLQLVCGFRRAYAAKAAGLKKVPVVVRELGDEQAYVLSYAENEFRKTFGDLDRAAAIVKLKRSGKTTVQVAALYRLGERQVQRLGALIDYPAVLKNAVGDHESGVSLAHALHLMQAEKKYRGFDVAEWVKRVKKEKLSIKDMLAAIRADFGKKRRASRSFSVSGGGDHVAFTVSALLAAPARTREAALRRLEDVVQQLRKAR